MMIPSIKRDILHEIQIETIFGDIEELKNEKMGRTRNLQRKFWWGIYRENVKGFLDQKRKQKFIYRERRRNEDDDFLAFAEKVNVDRKIHKV